MFLSPHTLFVLFVPAGWPPLRDGLGVPLSNPPASVLNHEQRIEAPLSSSDTLAVNALGQLAENPRVVALRNFIMGWRVSYLSSDGDNPLAVLP